MLETVPGVLGVYAVTPRSKGEDELDLFVHVEANQRCIVEVHYALRKIVRQERLHRIAILQDVPPRLQGRVTEISLSGAERFAAMNRVSVRTKALEEDRRITAEHEARTQKHSVRDAPHSVVVFDNDERVVDAVCQAFPESGLTFTSDFKRALAASKTAALVLCRATSAFGAWGFVSRIAAAGRPALAGDTIILVEVGHRERVQQNLALWRLRNRCLVKPVSAESLRLITTAPLGYEVVNLPFPPTRSFRAEIQRQTTVDPFPPVPKLRTAPRVSSRTPIVLLVDEEPDTESLVVALSPGIHLMRVSDEWTVLDKLALSEIDLVLCNASMRIAGDKPLYRLIWNTRPELKSRTALIVDPHRMPASARGESTRGVITRPITADGVKALLAAYE